MSALWETVVADLAGQELGEMTGAKAREVTLVENGGTTYAFSNPLTSAQAELVSCGDRRIKAYRTPVGGSRTLRFHGTIWAPEEAGAAGQMRTVAADPWVMLERRITQAAMTSDQGSIIKALVDAANALGETGIRALAENITSSVTRTVDWSGTRKPLSEVVSEFAGYFDGCDTELRPLDGVPGKLVDLVVHGSRRGTVRNESGFEFGADTVNNCSDASRVTDMSNIANYITAYGDPGIAPVVVYDVDSIARYGRYEAEITFSDVTLIDALTALAVEALLKRKDPKRTITVTPGPNAPSVYDDWEIGDTVPLNINKGVLRYEGPGRITAATISINDNGGERITSVSFDQENDDAAA